MLTSLDGKPLALPPTVAVCMPCGTFVRSETAMSLCSLVVSSRIRPTLIRGESSIVSVARDRCIEMVDFFDKHVPEAKKQDPRAAEIEWVLFMDSDIVVPPSAIMRLLAHGKSVVGATYIRRSPPFDVLVKTLDDKPMEVDSGLVEVAGLPLGFVLIRRDIFKKLKRPYFRFVHDEEHGVTIGEDVIFFETVRRLGHSVWLDVDLTKETAHICEQPIWPQGDAHGRLKLESLGGNVRKAEAMDYAARVA